MDMFLLYAEITIQLTYILKYIADHDIPDEEKEQGKMETGKKIVGKSDV